VFRIKRDPAECSVARRPVNSTVMLLLSLILVLAPTTQSSSLRSIRDVDFNNFTYPNIGAKGTFTVKDGREPNVEESRSVIDVIYGDVTADGTADAMVVQSQNIRGSAIPYFVYVFTMNGAKPKLLWSFATGDRAQGGLRRLFAHSGNLVVELYGSKAYVGMPDYDASADCAACATHYTRSRYAWRNGHFQRVGNLEVVAHDGSANYLVHGAT